MKNHRVLGRIALGVVALAALGAAPGVPTDQAGKHRIDGPARLLWETRYDGPVSSVDTARTIALSPDGTRAYITGFSKAFTGYEHLTLAYDTADGKRLWEARYSESKGQQDVSRALAVSRDGRMVYLTGSLGTKGGAGPRADYATAAYDAESGARKWVTRYNPTPAAGDSAGTGTSLAWAIAVSPDGTRVFVTGRSDTPDTAADIATVAYSTADGKQLWAVRYAGPGDDQGLGIAVSRDGERVFITGYAENAKSGIDYVTIAYDATDGRQIWLTNYSALGAEGDYSRAIQYSPDGLRVFVTGEAYRPDTGLDCVTVAYSAADGKQLWVAREDGPGHRDDSGLMFATGASGATIFVAGNTSGAGGSDDIFVTAYEAATGKRLWVYTFDGDGRQQDHAFGLAVSPNGQSVFVTGSSRGIRGDDDIATIGLDARTGLGQWIARYQGPELSTDEPAGLAVSPDGLKVFVTGRSKGHGTDWDCMTLAYALPAPPPPPATAPAPTPPPK